MRTRARQGLSLRCLPVPPGQRLGPDGRIRTGTTTLDHGVLNTACLPVSSRREGCRRQELHLHAHGGAPRSERGASAVPPRRLTYRMAPAIGIEPTSHRRQRCCLTRCIRGQNIECAREESNFLVRGPAIYSRRRLPRRTPSALVGSGGGNRTHDLLGMNQVSCYCSTPLLGRCAASLVLCFPSACAGRLDFRVR